MTVGDVRAGDVLFHPRLGMWRVTLVDDGRAFIRQGRDTIVTSDIEGWTLAHSVHSAALTPGGAA